MDFWQRGNTFGNGGTIVTVNLDKYDLGPLRYN